MTIKYILSDLDGVIRKFPRERDQAIEKKLGLPSGIIFGRAFEKSLLTQAVCGRITDEVWRTEIQKSLASVCSNEVASSAVEAWSDFIGIVDYRYLNYLEVRFSGVPLALLTNGTSRLKSDLAKIGIKNRFFRVFNSAELGVCKPDKKIYIHVFENLDCRPSEILFIDDSLSNVQAAEQIGMKTHHYKSFEVFQAVYT